MSSSSTSSNSESEPIKGKLKTATAAKSKVQEDSSDSDFVSTKKHAKEKASPKQSAASSKDLSSTRFSFQKMLMNSNNKFNELLKSKQSIAELSPKSNKNKPANASQDSSQEFSPIASSTQIISSQYLSSAKQLKKQKEALSSSDSESERRKQRAKQNKQIIDKKRNLSESNSESESDDGKRKRDKEQKSKVKKLRKDQNSESDKSAKTLTKTKTHKRLPSSDSSSSEDKHSSSRISSNKTVLEKARNNTSSRSDSDYQQKSKPKLAKHVKKPATEITQISAKTRLILPESLSNDSSASEEEPKKISAKARQVPESSSDDSSASEEEPTRKPKPARKSHKQASSSDSEEAHVKSASKSKVQLRKFEEGHESISRVKEQLDRVKNLIVKKDIFLVQIPKSLDPNKLVGTKISLSETVRVPEKSRKYDCIPSNAAQEPIAVSFNEERVDVIKPAGSIKMQRHLKSTHIPDFAGSANNHVAFPNDLKERHPLFGADYKDKINLEEHIQQKLKAAVESHTKKKKKKKHKNKDVEKGTEVQEEEIFKFLSQTLSPAEKVKRKSKDLATNENSFEIEPETKSKKKKKKNKEIDITDELKVDTSHTESIELKKKHKHKKREKSWIEEVDSEVYKNTIFDDEMGKKRLNEEDVETDSPKKKKKKHKKEHKNDDSSNLIDEMLLSKNLEMSTSKKKKKKYE